MDGAGSAEVCVCIQSEINVRSFGSRRIGEFSLGEERPRGYVGSFGRCPDLLGCSTGAPPRPKSSAQGSDVMIRDVCREELADHRSS